MLSINAQALKTQVNAWDQGPTVDPSSFKNVVQLNQAIHSGQINGTQWLKQFQTIQNQQPGQKPQSLGDALKYATKQLPTATKNLGAGLYNGVAKPIEQIPTDATLVASNLVNKALGRKPITPQQIAQNKNAPSGLRAGVKYAGATGKNAQLGSDVGQAGLDVLAPGIDSLATKGAGKVAGGLAGALLKAGARTTANAGIGSAYNVLGLGTNNQKFSAKNVKSAAKQGAVAGALLTGVPEAGIGAVRGVGKAFDASGAKAALGRNSAVNSLVDSTKANAAMQKASQGADVGAKVVKEANTTRIPVSEPVEPVASPTKNIPVQGKSTQTAGKVKTSSDAAYVKATQKLSNNYDKEMKMTEGQPPIAAKITQIQIDRKYQTLRQNLDNQYGKTDISFNGPTKTVKEPSPFRPSAFDKQVAPATVAEPTGGANTATATVPTTKTIPVTQEKTNPLNATPAEQPQPGSKIAGSALRTQQKAVEAGMEREAVGKAQYSTTSYKADAAEAVKLANENPEKAMDIAMGRTAGNNASHEAAVYHAVKDNAIKEAKASGDWSTVQDLASAPRHTAVSEAAQRLGAEGYNNPHDPVALMNDVAKTREKAVAKKSGTTVQKAATTIKQEVKTKPVSRQDWHSFISDLQC